MGGRAAAWPPCGGIVFHIDMLSGIVGWEERNGILHRGPSPAHHHLRPVTGLCGQAFNCWAFREDINHVNAMKTTMSSPVIHSEPYLTRVFISICYTQTRVDIDAWKVRLDSWLYRVRVRRLRVYGGIFCPCWVSQQVEVYVSKDNLNSWCFEAKTIWFLKYCPNMVLSNRPFVYLPVLCTITEYFFGLARSKHAINWNTVVSQLCRKHGDLQCVFQLNPNNSENNRTMFSQFYFLLFDRRPLNPNTNNFPHYTNSLQTDTVRHIVRQYVNKTKDKINNINITTILKLSFRARKWAELFHLNNYI